MNICKNILIIANGKFPEIDLIKEIISKKHSIVCCDGAANKMYNNGFNLDVIIGDMDSIDTKLKSKLSDKIITLDEQKTNDLHKTLNWLEDKDVESVIILGAGGLRDDHAIGNILLLLENKYNYKIRMITEFGKFDVMNTGMIDGDNQYSQSFSSFMGQAVSLFCLDKNATLISHGLKYPLDSFSFSKLYDASLNASIRDSFTISCNKNNVNILVYRANEET